MQKQPKPWEFRDGILALLVLLVALNIWKIARTNSILDRFAYCMGSGTHAEMVKVKSDAWRRR